MQQVKNCTSTSVHQKHPANGMSNYKLQFEDVTVVWSRILVFSDKRLHWCG